MNNDLNWSNRRRTHMTLAIFATVLPVAIIAAFATTIHRVDTRLTSNDVPPGTTRLAHPHPPLDRGPGAAVKYVSGLRHREGPPATKNQLIPKPWPAPPCAGRWC